MSKTKKEINDEWNELYHYVKFDILCYNDNKAMPKYMVLRLKGMVDGNFIKNKKIENQASYSYSDILMTFKINKYKIINLMKTNTFNNENHKFNFIMKIIENDINNVVDMINRKEMSETKAMNTNTIIENVQTNDKAKYTKKTKEVKNNILDNLW